MPAEKETWLFCNLVIERLALKEYRSTRTAEDTTARKEYHQAQASAFKESIMALTDVFDSLDKRRVKED